MLGRVDEVSGWPVAFRGSAAVAAGLLTKDQLRGPRYRRLFPDTYVRAGDRPDLALRSRAGYRYVEGRGVLAGYSAAELLGASCGPADAPVEVVVPGAKQRVHAGLVVRRDRIAPGEVAEVGGIRLTSPLRTAYDLARRGDLVDGVVAVDALARVGRFEPDLLLNFAARYWRSRGNHRVPDVLGHADRRSGSPMETRLRLLLVRAGLPRPQVQWVVQDEVARTAVWLDLAYPECRVGIEYDGEVHADPAAVLRDIGRHTALLDKGWRVYRYTRLDLLRRPETIVDQIRRALSTGSSSTSAGSEVSPTPLT
jgi:very-short-patch-repair endonuclease